MIIKAFSMKENLINNTDTFSPKRTLLFSQENSKGKSTYLRLLFYAFGYSIPQMRDIIFTEVQTKIHFEERNKEFFVSRKNLTLKVSNITDEEEFYFTLPFEQEAFLAYIFNYNNIKVLKNLLGIIYVDQDKGWSLLNRGKVIGKIGFSIEELLAGLNNIDCNDLLAEKERLQQEKRKYSALLDINELKDEVYEKNGEIFISDIEKELTNKISMINLKITNEKSALSELNQVISNDKKFFDYINSMKLEVSQNGIVIPVNQDTLLNAHSNMELLKVRRSIVLSDIEKLNKELNLYQDKLQDYLANNTQITKLLGPSANISVNKQLANVNIDQTMVEKHLDEATRKLTEVNRNLKMRIRWNNPYIDAIYENVLKYAKILQIDDKLSGRKDYIFTDDLKSMSGAILQKMVFAFKVAFLKVIEEQMGTKLFMVLDSPRGKELDENNAKLIDELIATELKPNQVIIASIYKFKADKEIEIKHHAIEERT